MARTDIWTEAQITELQRLCPKFNDDEVADMIRHLRPGATRSGVAWQRRLLGIVKKGGGAHHCGKSIVEIRNCLSCDHEFGSAGPHNRVCDPCKLKNANVAA